MSDDCVKLTDPSMYCVDTKDSFATLDSVQNEEPISKETQEQKNADKTESSTFDIVKATQYGVFERVLHLLDVEKVNVNARDSENVTLLHWAAINNRY